MSPPQDSYCPVQRNHGIGSARHNRDVAMADLNVAVAHVTLLKVDLP